MGEKLNGFKNHGVIFKGNVSNNYRANCIFCGGENKFYVNVLNTMWDCKKCGLKGNFYTFLSKVSEVNLKEIDETDKARLSQDRGLPLSAFIPWEIGKSNTGYTIPVKNESGRIVDLRRYVLGEKVKGTSGCNVGLMGLHNLVKIGKEIPVYVCEGEWDGMAMHWLLQNQKKQGVVVAVPGANTFKQEWTQFFEGRIVYSMYDNDMAGEEGEVLLKERLTKIAKSVSYLHWTDGLPKGFDIRDFIIEEAVKKRKPSVAYSLLHQLFKTHLRRTSETVLKEIKIEIRPVSLEDVYKVFKKWMFIKDFTPIQVTLSTVISNKLSGDPLWMFLVASPGGSKTEILSACSEFSEIYTTSSLTSHSLISGATFIHGKDPSIIPEIHNKTLVIKDFTSILSKPIMEKEEIFGTLRDAYDGKCGKVFGNGIRRSYESHFSILAGVTPVIHDFYHQYSGLGERFLKYQIGDNLVHHMETEIIAKAIENVSNEIKMREELSSIVKNFLDYKTSIFPSELPDISFFSGRIIRLSQFGARVRGTIGRDRFNSEIVTSKPSAEVGSRLGKQLAKLAISLAIVRGSKKIEEEEYEIVKKVMIDTLPQINVDLLKCLFHEAPSVDDSLKTKEIASKIRYPSFTISKILADMDMLDIVKRTGTINMFEWSLSDYTRSLIKESELFT